ncbi:MAG: hypothetical protein KAV18_04160 [Candidatus Omnitrophica bacterium]|nr:hypothetical protein [Candidatus Omnitrophota bacterium]
MGKIVEIEHEFDTLNQMEVKLRMLVGNRVRNKTKIQKACERMDDLRQKLAKRTKGWNTTAEIRKWRDLKCMS